jgi:hypothetical protein
MTKVSNTPGPGQGICAECERASKALLLDLLTREDFASELKDLSGNLRRSSPPDGSGTVTLKGEAEELLAFAVTMLREPLLEWLAMPTSKH